MKYKPWTMMRERGSGRPPLRTLKELADDLGVAPQRLAALLRWRDGPSAVRHTASLATRNAWYDPRAVRAWWAGLPDAVRSGKAPA